MQAYILDEYGDTESAATVDTTAEAIRFFNEHGVDFTDVDLDESTTFCYRRPNEKN